jgi:torulene dioxygenase
LTVEGNIPIYAAGTLFRTGLGPRKLETDAGTTFRVNHWFDGFAQVHRFQIHPPTPDEPSIRVTYNSRSSCDAVIERIKRKGKDEGFTFGAKYDLCTSYFQKLQSLFRPAPPALEPDSINMSVTLSANFPGLNTTGGRLDRALEKNKIVSLCNKTDISYFQMLDPQTLEPIGLAQQKSLHPSLKGPSSATHAKSDPITGDVFNYNLEYGRKGTYRVFKVSASTGQTSILATISADSSYLHSLFLTENYVILCVWNAFFSLAGASVFYHMNIVDSLAKYDETRPATWYVIDRTPVDAGGKGLVATYESSHFFAFHTINAYEEPDSQTGQTDIVADIIAYDSHDCVKRYYLDNMMSDSPTAKGLRDGAFDQCRATVRRFRLPNIPSKPSRQRLKADLVFSKARELYLELPAINPTRLTRKHRYVYAVVDTGKSAFFDGLVKYDVDTHESFQWSYHGQTAGEPIFVADPDSDEEDGGVLLSVVLDGIEGKSYLLVLDAKTMKEVGRASVDGVVGFGFHGTHVPSGRDAVAIQL